MDSLRTFQVLIYALLLFAFAIAVWSAVTYIRRKDVPGVIFAPILACFCGTLILVGLSTAYRQLAFVWIALPCAVGMLFLVRRERTYRRRHGLEEPYEQIARKLRAKAQQRRSLRK